MVQKDSPEFKLAAEKLARTLRKAIRNYLLMTDAANSGNTPSPPHDIVSQPKTIERIRIWEHVQGPDFCDRKSRKVYTPPQKLPDPCRSCGKDEWTDKGYARRIKETKQIIYNEPKPKI